MQYFVTSVIRLKVQNVLQIILLPKSVCACPMRRFSIYDISGTPLSEMIYCKVIKVSNDVCDTKKERDMCYGPKID